MTLDGRPYWFALVPNDARPCVDAFGAGSIIIPQGSRMELRFAAFVDPETLRDISNVESAKLVIRQDNARGRLLVTKTVASDDMDAALTIEEWRARDGQHFTIVLEAEETNWPIVAKWRGALWWELAITTTGGQQLARWGEGQCQRSGISTAGESGVTGDDFYNQVQSDARFEALSRKDQSSGYAGLDASGKLSKASSVVPENIDATEAAGFRAKFDVPSNAEQAAGDRFVGFESETADSAGSFNVAKALAASGAYGNPLIIPEHYPPDWGDFRPCEFFYQPGRGYFSNFNPADYDVTGGPEIWVDPVNGSDSNNGSEGAPKATLSSVLAAVAENMVIHLKSGYYDAAHGWAGVNLNEHCKIICEDGIAILAHDTSGTWSATDGQPNVFEYTKSSGDAPVAIIDRAVVNAYSLPTRYTLASSIEDCNSTAGSYYVSGTTIYVHTIDERSPDTDIRVTLSGQNGRQSSHNIYVENVWFWGGEAPFNAIGNSGGTVCFVACDFGYATGSSRGCLAVERSGGGSIFLKRCRAYEGRSDGFNYHDGPAGTPDFYVYEEECHGFENGWLTSSPQHNGSTIHDGGTIIRLNCRYWRNENRNVHDVGNGTNVWCVSVLAGKARSQVIGESADFVLGGNGGGDTCVGTYTDCASIGGSVTPFVANEGSIARGAVACGYSGPMVGNISVTGSYPVGQFIRNTANTSAIQAVTEITANSSGTSESRFGAYQIFAYRDAVTPNSQFLARFGGARSSLGSNYGAAVIESYLAGVATREATFFRGLALPPISDPGNTGSGAKIYSRINGSKTELVAVFPSGAVQVLATEP